MSIKVGITGENPSLDVFAAPLPKNKWVFIVWDKSPEEWMLLESDNYLTENDLCNADMIQIGDKILISSITEVFLELEPSISFRIYLGSEVLHLTSSSRSREVAATWTDAIFAAMKLQSFDIEDTLNLRIRWQEEFKKREKERESLLQQQQLILHADSTEDDFANLIGDPSKNNKSTRRGSLQIDFSSIYGNPPATLGVSHTDDYHNQSNQNRNCAHCCCILS